MTTAAGMAVGPARVLMYNLVEHIANGLALYVYYDQENAGGHLRVVDQPDDHQHEPDHRWRWGQHLVPLQRERGDWLDNGSQPTRAPVD